MPLIRRRQEWLDGTSWKNLVIIPWFWWIKETYNPKLLFESDFPSQDFIKIRIQELYQIRNKIAHNANVTQEEFDMLKMYSNALVFGEWTQIWYFLFFSLNHLKCWFFKDFSNQNCILSLFLILLVKISHNLTDFCLF